MAKRKGGRKTLSELEQLSKKLEDKAREGSKKLVRVILGKMCEKILKEGGKPTEMIPVEMQKAIDVARANGKKDVADDLMKNDFKYGEVTYRSTEKRTEVAAMVAKSRAEEAAREAAREAAEKSARVRAAAIAARVGFNSGAITDSEDDDWMAAEGTDEPMAAPAAAAAPMAYEASPNAINIDLMNAIRDKTLLEDQILEKVRELLDRGADQNVRFEANNTFIYEASKLKYPKVVGMLIECGGDPTSVVGDNHATPLHAAALNGCVETVKALLEDERVKNSVNECSKTGHTALNFAASKNNGDVIKLLLQAGADPNIASSDNECTPLHTASFAGNIETVKALLEDKRVRDQVNRAAGKGGPALIAAVESGSLNRLDVARLLLQAGADPTIVNSGGYTPFHIAAKSDSADVARLLLQAGADPNIASSDGFTPLHVAAKYSSSEDVVKFLVEECHIDVNAKDKDGLTALHISAKFNKAEVVKYITMAGGNLYAKDVYGKTAEEFAKQNEHCEIKVFLKKFRETLWSMNPDDEPDDAEIRRDVMTQVEEEMAFEKLTLQSFLKSNDFDPEAGVDQQRGDGERPLGVAIINGNLENVRFLVENCGADINARDHKGYTALHILARVDKDPESMASVVTMGGDVDIVDKDGVTAAEVAKEVRNTDVAKFLEKFKERFDAKYQALVNASTEDVKKLRRETVSDVMNEVIIPGLRRRRAVAGLPLAEETEEPNSLLDRSGVLMKDLRSGENTPEVATTLHQAAQQCNVGKVQHFLDNGADVFEKDENGKTPLDLVLDQKVTKLIESISRHDVELSMKKLTIELIVKKMLDTLTCQQLLFTAAEKNYGLSFVSALKECMEFNDDDIVNYINETNDAGFTPSHVAADLGNRRAGSALLMVGANQGVTDGKGRTVEGAAREAAARGWRSKSEKIAPGQVGEGPPLAGAAPASDVAGPEGNPALYASRSL